MRLPLVGIIYSRISVNLCKMHVFCLFLMPNLMSGILEESWSDACTCSFCPIQSKSHLIMKAIANLLSVFDTFQRISNIYLNLVFIRVQNKCMMFTRSPKNIQPLQSISKPFTVINWNGWYLSNLGLWLDGKDKGYTLETSRLDSAMLRVYTLRALAADLS